MPLINTSVPNLIQGVSQQPDTLKFEGQCKEQENAFPSVADGLRKRPNTNLIKWEEEEAGDNPFIHAINRSETEKYLLVVTDTAIKVYNVDGTSATINGGSEVATSLISYLNPSTPRSDLKALTVGDTTWIINKQQTTAMDSPVSDPVDVSTALVFVKQAGYDKDYSVGVFGGTPKVSETNDTSTDATDDPDETEELSADSSVIAASLQRQLTTIGSLTATVEGSTIKLVNTGSSDFEIKTADGFGDKGLGVVYKEVAAITDLPVVAPQGFKVRVRGDLELSEDDYFVRFETNEGLSTGTMGRGGWVETIGWNAAGAGITTNINTSTMPYKLTSTAENTFTLAVSTWSTRDAGDTDSNPNPSFIGKKLSNLFFYKNRLGLLAEDKVIMSEAGEYFNFFRTTVTNLLDTAPIDVGVAAQNVTNLESSVGFQENLILFSNGGQFVLRGADLLTPETVSITPITHFAQTTGVDPIALGSNVYFPFSRGKYSGMREFTLSATGDTYNGADITSHIPSYIPKNVIDIAGSSTEDVIAVLSNEEKANLYIYKFYWRGAEKVLSSWCVFSLTGCEIRGIEFIDSTLYILADRNFSAYGSAEPGGGSFMESTYVPAGKDFMLLSMVFSDGIPEEEDLNDTNLGFITHLDYRVERKIPAGQTRLYNMDGLLTPIDWYPLETNEFADGIGEVSVDVYGLHWSTSPGRLKVIDRATGMEIPFKRDLLVDTAGEYYMDNPNDPYFDINLTEDRNVFVGVTYDTHYTFSEQIFKRASYGRSKTPTQYTKAKIRNGTLFYDNTAFFQVKVTPENRDTYTNEFTTQTVGGSVLDTVDLDSGSFRFPVFTKPEDTTITIENNSAYPSTFQSAEFESFVHHRSNRHA